MSDDPRQEATAALVEDEESGGDLGDAAKGDTATTFGLSELVGDVLL
jgi:hypothetical protein